MYNVLRNYLYYGGYYGDYNSPFSFSSVDPEVVGFVAIASLVVAIIVYFTFLSKRNAGRFTGFTGWLYEVLNFGKLIIEALLKICYMFIALLLSIMSLIHMGDSFGEGLLMLIVFNVGIRVGYECLLMLVMICKNTREINNKLKDQNKNNNNISNNNNNNNIMNGGRTNYTMPPQQSYGQTPYVQQPNTQTRMNRQPMGTQRPMGAQKPYGTQQPMNNHYQGASGSTGPTGSTGSSGPTGPAVQPINPNQGVPQVNSKQEELPKVQNVKYCLKCGNVVEHDDVFCPNCGTKVVE